MSTQPIVKDNEAGEPQTLANRLGDGVVFISAITLFAVAIAALAFATPVVLAISAIVGLTTKNNASTGWRPAGA